MLTLPATVTMAEARDTLRVLGASAAGEAGAEWTIDASGLVRFDSAALAVLLECKRRAQAQGKRFRLVGAPTRLLDLARLYGLAPLLESPA